MSIDYESIRLKIKKYRTEAHMSQEELAEEVFVNSQHISRIENGKIKPSLDLVIWIANALKVSANELLYDCLDYPSSTIDQDIHKLFDSCNPDEKELLRRIMIFMKSLFSEFHI